MLSVDGSVYHCQAVRHCSCASSQPSRKESEQGGGISDMLRKPWPASHVRREGEGTGEGISDVLRKQASHVRKEGGRISKKSS